MISWSENLGWWGLMEWDRLNILGDNVRMIGRTIKYCNSSCKLLNNFKKVNWSLGKGKTTSTIVNYNCSKRFPIRSQATTPAFAPELQGLRVGKPPRHSHGLRPAALGTAQAVGAAVLAGGAGQGLEGRSSDVADIAWHTYHGNIMGITAVSTVSNDM